MEGKREEEVWGGRERGRERYRKGRLGIRR